MRRQNRRYRSPDEILAAALVKERASYAFYAGLLEGTQSDIVSDLVVRLRDEEANHIKVIEKQLSLLRTGRI